MPMEPLVGHLGVWFARIRITDTHTDTQDKYCNPPAHAHRGLIIVYKIKKKP